MMRWFESSPGSHFGELAQLREHLTCNQEVTSLILVLSTICHNSLIKTPFIGNVSESLAYGYLYHKPSYYNVIMRASKLAMRESACQSSIEV